MKEYNKQLKKLMAQMIPQLKARHPQVSDDVIETMADKSARNILKDPMVRVFY